VKTAFAPTATSFMAMNFVPDSSSVTVSGASTLALSL